LSLDEKFMDELTAKILTTHDEPQLNDGHPYDDSEPAPVWAKALEGFKMPDAPYKYQEDIILQEIAEYLASTYKGHYVGEDNVQSLDLIIATGHATGFNVGNILKYGSRYGKKKGYNKDDLLKVIHYLSCLIIGRTN